MECHILKVPKLSIPALEVSLTLSIMSHSGILISNSQFFHLTWCIFSLQIPVFLQSEIEHFSNVAR